MDIKLKQEEIRDADRRSAPSATVVHEAIRLEGEEELQRPSQALFWSGLAAGLSMGFSLVSEALLGVGIPDAPWRPLVTKLGYAVGFLIVVLGRQQLFTENTLTPVLELLRNRKLATLLQVGRLWTVVLLANLTGALIFALLLAKTGVFETTIRQEFLAIAQAHLGQGFWGIMVKAIFAGWLIALMVWLLPFAETGRISIIIIITYLVGLGGFSHIIAGSVEAFYLLLTGHAHWLHSLTGFFAPTLIGNILGGVALVAAINHAQVLRVHRD